MDPEDGGQLSCDRAQPGEGGHMGKNLNARVEQLYATAVEVDGHAEALFTGHSQSDGRIESAETGLKGVSARALGVKATSWRHRTALLGGAVAGHADALRASGLGFAGMEERHAAVFDRLRPQEPKP
jgi:hypothetical protein